MPNRARLSVLLVLLGLSLVAWWQREPVRGWLARRHPEERQQSPELVGRPAPELPLLQTLNGPPVTLAALRGRVVLLHFWTFGCGNCERMVPRYVEWDARLRSRGLAVVGVHAPETSLERDVPSLARYAAAHGIHWPVVLDPDFRAWERYHARVWPTAVLIDRAGVVRAVYLGDNSARQIESQLQDLLGG